MFMVTLFTKTIKTILFHLKKEKCRQTFLQTSKHWVQTLLTQIPKQRWRLHIAVVLSQIKSHSKYFLFYCHQEQEGDYLHQVALTALRPSFFCFLHDRDIEVLYRGCQASCRSPSNEFISRCQGQGQRLHVCVLNRRYVCVCVR